MFGDAPFLDADRDYPLGRHDLFGLDTTPDYQLVVDEIGLFFAEIWNANSLSLQCPSAYVGSFIYDAFEAERPADVLNLATRERNSLHLTFND